MYVPSDSFSGAASQNAVTLRNLTRRFGEFVAVNRVSLEVARGEIFGFLGPNGAGKSTTIRMLCGILPPSEGSGTVAGFDIGQDPEEIKSRIGYMSQRFSLYEDLTVEENIDFYSGIYRIPRERRGERKAWVVQMAGLQDHLGSKSGTLSGGWKQRLALGCAILHEPPIVFLDEPTSGVDPISRRSFWELIYRLAGNGVTVFVTTHYMEEAECCDRLGFIYRGELVALGTPPELKGQFRGKILEVSCELPHEALEELERVPGVRQAALFAAKVHVTVDDAGQAEPAIMQALAQRNPKVEQIDPSLEDLFVALIEERERGEGRTPSPPCPSP